MLLGRDLFELPGTLLHVAASPPATRRPSHACIVPLPHAHRQPAVFVGPCRDALQAKRIGLPRGGGAPEWARDQGGPARQCTCHLSTSQGRQGMPPPTRPARPVRAARRLQAPPPPPPPPCWCAVARGTPAARSAAVGRGGGQAGRQAGGGGRASAKSTAGSGRLLLIVWASMGGLQQHGRAAAWLQGACISPCPPPPSPRLRSHPPTRQLSQLSSAAKGGECS